MNQSNKYLFRRMEKIAPMLFFHSFNCHFLNQERVFLTISNYIFTTIFVAEMTVKVKHPFFFFHLFLSPISTFLSIIHSLSPLHPLIISLKPLTALFHLPSFISRSLNWPKSIKFSSADFPSRLWLQRFTKITPYDLQKQFPEIILLFSLLFLLQLWRYFSSCFLTAEL